MPVHTGKRRNDVREALLENVEIAERSLERAKMRLIVAKCRLEDFDEEKKIKEIENGDS